MNGTEVRKKGTEKIERYMKHALLGEVYTTPKPGLVDLQDNGAHQDMDYRTFEKSTCAIVPYLSLIHI